MAENFYRDNEDLRYYVERGLDWGPLVELTEYFYQAPDHFESAEKAKEAYVDLLDLVGGFAATEIAPKALEIDREPLALEGGEVSFPPVQREIYEKLHGLDLHGMCYPRELGGSNCPLVLYLANTEILSRADVSVSAHHGFHGGIGMAMLVFSVREGSAKFAPDAARFASLRFEKEMEEIRRGLAFGSMDITEPDAGSDMARLRCSAKLGSDGVWRVSGQKIFITSGHGKYHFVIARTEEAKDPNDPFAGLAGLSMFLVPAYSDEGGTRRRFVTIERLEDKMGHSGSATCALRFEDAPAQLVGKRGEGFQYMLTLMNNARLAVGFECLGLAEAAFRRAKAYAAERISMGKAIERHEMIADALDEMEADILGIRALAMYGVFHEEMATKLALFKQMAESNAGHPLAKSAAAQAAWGRQAMHKRNARRVTPLLKYLAGEKAVEIARRAIQIHGGAGYIREYGAEKLLRDAVVMPIYEGTSQIQALMAMKDQLGDVIKHPQGFVKDLAQTRFRSLSARDPVERRVAKLRLVMLQAKQHLITRTVQDKTRGLSHVPVGEWPVRFLKNWDPKRDFSFAMLHAERFTKIACDVEIAERFLEQATRHPDRAPLLLRHLERAEPRTRFLLDEIETTGDRMLERTRDEASSRAAG